MIIGFALKKRELRILVGADDNGNLDGQMFTDEQLRSYAGLRNSGTLLPPPAMMVYKESFPEGEVAIIEVQPSEDTPVRYKGVIWIRIGARKAEANTEEERILTEKGQVHSSSFDGRPCREATIDNIDVELFIEPLIVEKAKDYRKDNPGLGCAKLYVIIKRLFESTGCMPGRDAFIELLRANGLMVQIKRRRHYKTKTPTTITASMTISPERLSRCDRMNYGSATSPM